MTDEAFPWFSHAGAAEASACSVLETRFSKPWTVEHRFESFAVFDANHRPLGYFYFWNEPSHPFGQNCLSCEEAWQLANYFAKLACSLHSAGTHRAVPDAKVDYLPTDRDSDW